MILRTNVKLNFGLHVLQKRDDGYHDIETLFVPCHEFGDTLEVISGDDYSRTSASLFAKYGPDGRPGLPLPDIYPDRARSVGRQREVWPSTITQGISEDGKLMITIARAEGVDWDSLKDLCAKAYFLLAKDFQIPPVKIFLEKNAPVGAGLGGGSADAAFTLKALNELFELNLSDAKLAEYASKLGSDCAFFVWNKPMIGTGRGEILEPFGLDLDGYVVKVLVPEGISVSTAEAYRGIVPHIPMEDRSIKNVLKRPIEEWKDLLVNDFEATVFKAHPELAAIKQSLYDSGAIYAAMSGSGSAIFGIYKK
ncbi:MAG: 4-(cytidine 5'-diphospho)-2-C-methyl-D-erythritol kinase [Bacteroidales bacterium]|nr:4-(cytidine 5'-diphospho)-2-C-methyl-D-erythritol kinase [Bacteroidales bacterium]